MVLSTALAAYAGDDPLLALGMVAIRAIWCVSFCHGLARWISNAPRRSPKVASSVAWRLAFCVFPVAVAAALAGSILLEDALDLVLRNLSLSSNAVIAATVGLPAIALTGWLGFLARGRLLERNLPPERGPLSRAAQGYRLGEARGG